MSEVFDVLELLFTLRQILLDVLDFFFRYLAEKFVVDLIVDTFVGTSLQTVKQFLLNGDL
jgi:hypothetical protein